MSPLNTSVDCALPLQVGSKPHKGHLTATFCTSAAWEGQLRARSLELDS